MESLLQVYSRVFWRFGTSYSTAVVCIYLIMVFFARRLRKLFYPLDLRGSLIVHNTICVILSAVSLVVMVLGLVEEGTILKITESNDTLRLGLLLYWISKYYELLDTVFMFLRHRLRQMSFLHVFHHASMAFLSDYAYNYASWPPMAFGLAINAGIHVIMYSYYGLTAVYPLESFSWKKRVTQLQILQFCLGICLCSYGYIYEGYCVYSVMYPIVLIILFSNYYYNTFVVARKDNSSSKSSKKKN